MSVRRLAEEHVQPESFAYSSENAAWAQRTIGKYPQGRQASAVIPLLMRAQDQEGWVTRTAIETVAQMLEMPYIRVLEVATFYTQFQLEPVGTRAHVQVCGTTPCMLRGAEEIRAVCEKHIHPEPHHRNADGTLSWEEVECLGACVNAPMVMIGPDTYEDLTPERFEAILKAFAAGEGDTIAPGPQGERAGSAPVGGRVTLLEKAHPHAHEEGGAPDHTEPDSPGKKHDVTTETAPAMEGPNDSIKASQAEAEREQGETGSDIEATQQAGREGAVGAESGAVEDVVETTKDVEPPRFTPPEGEKDDLKRISGLGPVIEDRLNQLGITHFSQLASLTEDETRRVDSALNLRGRITRDDWIGQAKTLAENGPDGQ